MSEFERAKRGFSAEEAYDLQRQYRANNIAVAGEQALYMYLNMPQFFPHQVVARGGAVMDLPLAADIDIEGSIGAVSACTALGELTLDQLLNDPRSRVQGFIVLHRGRIVFERYPGMRPEDNHLWWSSAKVLAGTLAAMLVCDGVLDPTRPVEYFLPEFAASGWQGTSVQDVADHCSGINAEELEISSYASPQSELSRLIMAERILEPEDGREMLTHNEALLSMTRKRPAGEVFEYSSANTNMLGLIIEKVTGRRYADVLSERIWSRIGAEQNGMMGLAPQGNAIAHGMFSSSLRDLARLGLAFTPTGQRQRPVISKEVLRMIQNGGRPNLYPLSAKRPTLTEWFGESPEACSWQWDAVFRDGDMFKAGFHGQALYVSPTRDVVAAFFSTSDERAQFHYLRPIAQSSAFDITA
ncbi:serine hydrolase domain-containing protein [Stenotrophobium rhamnosiphilum]|nr:serine hydrolase domain-containing protein [Stenotrophobium rhamnosiphilum]